jgi:hydroxymethylglutaryl-CoA lyase
MIKIIESPRDAMQGIKEFIPTEMKAKYINSLLEVGFDIIDFGSFVSPKAIPQLADTNLVTQLLKKSNSKTKLMAIVGNGRGAIQACKYDIIDFLGFPSSISPTFLQKNINSNIEKSNRTVAELQEICLSKNKTLIVYITMAFGNPYGDIWNIDLVIQQIEKLRQLGIKIISLSDITNIANPEIIAEVYSTIYAQFPEIYFGFHLHTTNESWYEKLDAAMKNQCNIIDTVMHNLGGCPMTGKELVANLQTSSLIEYLNKNHIENKLNMEAFQKAIILD